MAAEQYLLNTKQMAQFVADGFLRFDELVPAELNERGARMLGGEALRLELPPKSLVVVALRRA